MGDLSIVCLREKDIPKLLPLIRRIYPKENSIFKNYNLLLNWVIKSGNYDMIILDEVNCVLAKNLIPLDEVLEIIKSHGKVELVLTGRDAPQELMDAADYVSVVSGLKHPWQKGIVARKGIEY